MPEDLSNVLRIQREHGGISEKVDEFLDTLEKTNMVTAERIKELGGFLAALHRDLNDHISFEEKEVIPCLASHAAEIITRSLSSDHEKLLAAVAELLEQSQRLADGLSDETSLGMFQARLKEKIQDIRWLLDDHVRNREMILELADRTLDP